MRAAAVFTADVAADLLSTIAFAPEVDVTPTEEECIRVVGGATGGWVVGASATLFFAWRAFFEGATEIAAVEGGGALFLCLRLVVP